MTDSPRANSRPCGPACGGQGGLWWRRRRCSPARCSDSPSSSSANACAACAPRLSCSTPPDAATVRRSHGLVGLGCVGWAEKKSGWVGLGKSVGGLGSEKVWVGWAGKRSARAQGSACAPSCSRSPPRRSGRRRPAVGRRARMLNLWWGCFKNGPHARMCSQALPHALRCVVGRSVRQTSGRL
jgi:hypothetical protein